MSVIIPCLNEPDAIREVLDGVPAYIDEVIVVDNNSSDGTAEVARSCGASVVRGDIRGYGRAYKKGFSLATGDTGVIREAYRVLRPDGRMLIVVPLIWQAHQAPNEFFRFTRYGLQRLLSEAGLEIATLAPLGDFFWVVGRYSFCFLKFWRRGLRSIFLPLLAPFFGLLIPLVCCYLNPLDHTGQYPLGYVCEARRPG